MHWSKTPAAKTNRGHGWPITSDEPSGFWRGVIRSILEVVPGGVIRAGKTAYTDDANAGFWLGVDTDALAKFNIGNASWWLHWTGTKLETNSDISFIIPATLTTERAVKWLSGSTVVTYLGAFLSAADNTIRLFADAISGRDSTVDLWASSPTGKAAFVRAYAESAAGREAEVEVLASDSLGRSEILLTAETLTYTGEVSINTVAAPGYGAISVKDPDFAAVGDGITNDAAAIQAALTAAGAASPPRTVIVPPGIYAIGSALTIPDGVRLQGTGGFLRSQLKLTAAAASIAIAKPAGAITYQAAIENLYVNANSAAANAITLTNASECTLRDVLILNPTAKGVAISGAYSGILNVENLQTSGCPIAIDVSGGASIWLRNCNLYNSGTLIAFSGTVYDVHLIDSWCEAFDTGFLWDWTSASLVFTSLRAHNSYFISSNGGGSYTCRLLKAVASNNTYSGIVRDVQLSSCHFSTTAAKDLVEVAWGAYVGGGSNRFFATLRNNHWHIATNATAWLKTSATETSYEYVRVLIDNPQHGGALVPLQDGTERGLLIGLYPRAATAAPVAGPWLQGDIVWNTNPAPAGWVGWICTSAGSPGTWKGFGLIDT